MVVRVKNSFKRETISKKITMTEMAINCITNEPVLYANPEPTMEQMETAKNALHDAALAAANGGTTNTAAMYEREEELDDLYTLLVAFVQVKSKGIPENIRRAGMETVSNERKAPTLPAQPQQLTATTSAYPGEILLKWKRVPKVDFYLIEKSADGITDWSLCEKSKVCKKAIGGFTALTYTWFRVIAVGAAGDSPASEAVKALAV